jgi:hypothetical protein
MSRQIFALHDYVRERRKRLNLNTERNLFRD